MNNHSIKVPRLYKVSAQVAKEVSERIGSIKSLVYEKRSKHPNLKAIYALVTTLFQKLEEIETLLKRSQLLIKESRFDPWLAKVLIVELLWGKKYLPGQSKPENTLRAYEQIFKAHLSDTSTKESSYKVNNKPRYVRVNTLICNLNEAIDGFRDDSWTLNNFLDKTDYKGYLEQISSMNNDEFIVDIHVPNLLVFPPGTEFYKHPAYKNGSIILQDKASCLPVHILGAPPGSTVLDMCAAPGMKTTHLAAVLNDQGTVYATERDPKRFEILNKIVSNSGAKCIKTFNKDVLDCTNDDFPGVEYILVDPSCSGTGMTDRQQENEINSSRLLSLTGFQIKILRHALTRFPGAKRVVYSTCSILPDENEEVVRQVLETNYNFKLISASQFVGESWQSFGSPDYGDIGKFCLYAKPNQDYTNGFFVAVFERLEEGEENSFFNTRIFNFKKHVQANEKWKNKKQQKYGQSSNNEEFTEDINNTNEESKRGKNNRNGINTIEQMENNEDNDDHVNNDNNDVSVVLNRRKKKKKSKASVEDTIYENEKEDIASIEEKISDESQSKKKKKKNKVSEELGQPGNIDFQKDRSNTNEKSEKGKKDRKGINTTEQIENNEDSVSHMNKENNEASVVNSRRKKKKNSKASVEDTIYENEKEDIASIEEKISDESQSKKKKKKNKVSEELGQPENIDFQKDRSNTNEKSKKGKKDNKGINTTEQIENEDSGSHMNKENNEASVVNSRRKKKKNSKASVEDTIYENEQEDIGSIEEKRSAESQNKKKKRRNVEEAYENDLTVNDNPALGSSKRKNEISEVDEPQDVDFQKDKSKKKRKNKYISTNSNTTTESPKKSKRMKHNIEEEIDDESKIEKTNKSKNNQTLSNSECRYTREDIKKKETTEVTQR